MEVMELASAWKAQLSFSDRMATTLKLSETFQRNDSNLLSSEARIKARKTEDAALQRASTKTEYENICQQAISEYPDDSPNILNNSKSSQASLPNPTVGYQIGPYENCTYHKSGLFSTIYKGWSSTCSSLCAIKETTPSTEQAPHDSKREARLLQKTAHPRVIKLLEVNRLSDGRLLMSFPLMPMTLEDLLISDSSVALKSLIHQLFQGLAYIHGAPIGILHRDLKPPNILLSRRPIQAPEYDLCLADFGIAWHGNDPASEPLDAKITDIGTTCYRAPELLFGCRDYKEGIDLWSAGCIVAEMLMHDVRLRGEASKRDWTLFDAGELGSELALVKSILETLGTPNEERWPESKLLPDWGKMSFFEYPPKPWSTILPGVDEMGCNIVASLVRYQSTERTSAQKICDMLET